MIGGGYLGNTQWMAALSKPPELQAITPQITWSELMQGVDTLIRRHADDAESVRCGVYRVGDLLLVAEVDGKSQQARHVDVAERGG
jgi:hypothetical protein